MIKNMNRVELTNRVKHARTALAEQIKSNTKQQEALVAKGKAVSLELDREGNELNSLLKSLNTAANLIN